MPIIELLLLHQIMQNLSFIMKDSNNTIEIKQPASLPHPLIYRFLSFKIYLAIHDMVATKRFHNSVNRYNENFKRQNKTT